MQSRQQLWQVLPLGPVGHGASPYSSTSTFAGNPLLISPEPLVEQGLLTDEDLKPLTELPQDRVDYERLIPRKKEVLRTAFERFESDAGPLDRAEMDAFWQREAHWLDDYVLYAALKDEAGGAAWTDWDLDLVRREPDALERAEERLARERRMHAYWQWLFHTQWSALRAYCHTRDVELFGDLPIYVAPDSADVWANQNLFYLDDEGQPTVVAGVPPDYFSPDGQRWGNPIYRWDRMQENGFAWWIERMRSVLNRVDSVRLDHFRAFEAYWKIPSSEETAVNGEWAEGPGSDFFYALDDALGEMPIVAEDLGDIDDNVRALRDRHDLPGMAVLQFAFESGPSNAFLPHNYRQNLVAYTGTHDNNTVAGWWEHEPTEDGRDYATRYLNLDAADAEVHTQALRALLGSVADTVVTPVQDVLGLGESARMNVPGNPKGNWAWRLSPGQLDDAALTRLKTLTETFGRAPEKG